MTHPMVSRTEFDSAVDDLRQEFRQNLLALRVELGLVPSFRRRRFPFRKSSSAAAPSPALGAGAPRPATAGPGGAGAPQPADALSLDRQGESPLLRPLAPRPTGETSRRHAGQGTADEPGRP